jgi:hypothetical protein
MFEWDGGTYRHDENGMHLVCEGCNTVHRFTMAGDCDECPECQGIYCSPVADAVR